MATLLIAAHGTRSAEGSATTRALVDAVAAARPDVPVSLCFLDVAEPTLTQALDDLDGPVVVVPLLLSAGYHVLSDIPSIVAGRTRVAVSEHLGPSAPVLAAVVERLLEVSREPAATTVLAAIASSRSSARAEVDFAATQLAELTNRPVHVLALAGDVSAEVAELPAPIEVAVYLLAEGGFLAGLRSAVAGRGVVADPIGVHPALVALVWERYEETVGALGEVR